MNNIYWPVFKNIEAEINTLMFNIHFDDKQLDVYSSKISDLILRASTEIESLSKELYIVAGGTPKKILRYDDDCLKFLNQVWKLEHKQVILSSYNCFITQRIIEPFKKNVNSTIRNKLTYSWNNAYQNLKHNRSNSLEFGSVKNLLDVASALYILNIYYKNEEIPLGTNARGANFDASLGSSIFSVKLNLEYVKFNHLEKLKIKDIEECIYVVRYNKDSEEKLFKQINEFRLKSLSHIIKHPEDVVLGDDSSPHYIPKYEFKAVLNKNQSD